MTPTISSSDVVLAEREVANAARLASSLRLGQDADMEIGDEVEAGLTRAEALVSELRERAQGNVKAMFLQGWIAALRQDNTRAEELLSRAVKLDPLNAVAWNVLAELFWQRGDLVMAKDCLTTCLEVRDEADVKTLRNLSLLLRKMGETPKERVANTVESLQKAKDAIALDVQDAESWYVLGNAYLSLFFSMSYDGIDLGRALKAYGKSAELALLSEKPKNPDLYFNRAQVLGYLEDYELACADYTLAKQLDPQLRAEERIDAISRKVAFSADLVARKGHLKPKRFAELVAKLGADTSQDQPLHLAAAQAATPVNALTDLAEGDNKSKRLDIKVIMPLVRSSEPPVSFLVTDRAGNVFGLSVYHLDVSVLARVRPDSRVTIVDPLVKQVNFRGISYPIVQLRYPMQFFVNGEPLKAQIAHSTLDSQSV